MKIDDSFEVAAPLVTVWPILCDIPRVATCIPNAEITEKIDDTHYKAKVSIKVGPVAVSYRVALTVKSIDEATHTATIDVQGDELRGRGGVKATVISSVTESDGKTRVMLGTDAQISGVIATIGGRLIEGVAKKTVAEFAANLEKIIQA